MGKILVSFTLADGVTYSDINKWLDEEEWTQEHISDYDIKYWEENYEQKPLRVVVSAIQWDCDGDNPKDLGLPETATFEISHDDLEDIEEVISDELSDNFGFCHKGFKYEIMEE